MLDTDRFDAILLDLDGVITDTASVHASAWKRLFDDYLEARSRRTGEPFEAFSLPEDYLRYVDGKPRYDGVQSFLVSRGIELPWGSPEDDPQQETVCGLGNRKNDLFARVLDREGVRTFEGTVRAVRRWREAGLRLAVVSSSQNTRAVLEAASLRPLFDEIVDGNDLLEGGLRGKPAPDTFLEAARRLGVDAARAVVVEDAISGVEAGRSGAFGLVVGVARHGDRQRLVDHGADVAVEDLSELDGRTS